jgi:ABC-type Fe3+-hydroxamate transport system substrate-binding protein
MTGVVSLVPSATETLLAWGITPVAVTRFCEHPELQAVGGTKDPDVAAITALAPDVVVMCDEENRIEDAEALAAAGLALHTLRIRSVADVAPELAGLARRLGVPAPAVVGPAPKPVHMRAFVPIWRDRGGTAYRTLSADTYGSSLLAAVGVANVFATDTDRYPATTLDRAAEHRPDVVLAPSEPYPFGPRHRRELEAVAPVILVDGQDLFWWGVRTPGAAARLATAVDVVTG